MSACGGTASWQMQQTIHKIVFQNNRRMRDLKDGRFVTKEDLLLLMDADVTFCVYDQKSGNDLTGEILVQLLCMRAGSAVEDRPVMTDNFLRELIRIRAHADPAAVRRHLDRSVRYLKEQGLTFEESGELV
jgi:polyhydroxyalkanoate synthesis regulator protein